MCASCGFRDSIRELEEMVEDDKYQWAIETLQGILDNIVNRGHVTDRQLRAIENIKGVR